jgi:hypothetical protein
VKAFFYRKKKAQAHRSSYDTGSTDYGGSERSYAASETHKIFMLFRRLAASTSAGAVDFVTRSSTLTGFATASQSSTLGVFHFGATFCCFSRYLSLVS